MGEGILRSVEAVKNFNPNLSQNPFGYFSMVIWRAFQMKIKKEKKERAIRDQLIMVDELFSLMKSDEDENLTKDQIIRRFLF